MYILALSQSITNCDIGHATRAQQLAMKERVHKGGFILPKASSALSRFAALSRASQMLANALAAYLFILSTCSISARQRAPESVARRQMQQSSTVLNFRASRQRTPAILPIMYRCHALSLQRIELALTSVVTPRVKLSLSFLSPFSIYLINFIHIDS